MVIITVEKARRMGGSMDQGGVFRLEHSKNYGYFADNGRRFVITTPRTPARWFNYLFNDTYYMEVSETGQGNSVAFQPRNRTFNRGYRYFYLKDQ